MLAKLLARVVNSDARYDHLFTPFAPNGAPAQLMARLYRQYEDALADEVAPPQHAHFRALVANTVGAEVIGRLDGPALKRVYAAYAACFERAETYQFQLAQWRSDRVFRQALTEARGRVVTDLLAHADAERARRAHFSRWNECQAATPNLRGETLLDLIAQMTPDDWHEIVQRWDWDAGVSELNWITSQRACDRATAVFALCAGRPGLVATAPHNAGAHGGFIRALAGRLEGGFYPKAELGLGLSLRTRRRFEQEIETARATGESPWQLPDDLLTRPGVRAAEPKYTLRDGAVRYHYEYWLRRIAR
jgi:hypothetical protein